jgi:hypothetical protein
LFLSGRERLLKQRQLLSFRAQCSATLEMA